MTYDCFTFFNELDLLEIRLNILDPYVDYFVICESNFTFSGKKKPYYLTDNIERFSKWKDKILLIQKEFIAKDETGKDIENAFVGRPFDMAFKQKESLKNILEERATDDDIVIYGDVDEIPNPVIINRLKNEL